MWLNDTIIHAAQHLIKKKYHVAGLQDLLHQQKFSFQIQTGEFVQILNHGNNHWIAISNIGLANI